LLGAVVGLVGAVVVGLEDMLIGKTGIGLGGFGTGLTVGDETGNTMTGNEGGIGAAVGLVGAALGFLVGRKEGMLVALIRKTTT